MKKIVILLLVVVAILAVAPRFIGATAEDKIRELYQKAGENPSWNFEIVDYDRGWFFSTLKVNIGFSLPGVPNHDSPKLLVTHKLQHGPVLWQIGGLGFGLADTVYSIELSETARPALAEYKQAVNATSRMKFDGSNTSTLKINPFSMTEDGTDIEILAGEFKTDINTSGHVNLNGDWKGMTIKNIGGVDIEILGLSAQVNQTSITGEIFGPDVLFDGDMSLTLKSAKVAGEEPSSVENFSLTSTSKFNGDVANFNMFLGLGKLSVAGQDFTDLAYDVTFENISKEALLEFQKIYSNDAAGSDPMMALQNLQGLLPKFLEKDPVLKINRLGVKTTAGEISSSATLSIDQDKYDPNNMMTLMMAVNAVASGYAPEAFFSNLGLGPNIEMLIQLNFLIKDGDKLKFDASFKNGEAILNGAPVPLGGLSL